MSSTWWLILRQKKLRWCVCTAGTTSCYHGCAGARARQEINLLCYQSNTLITSPMWCMVYRCAKRRTCSCAGARVRQVPHGGRSCAGARARHVPHGVVVALVRVRGRRAKVSVSTTTYLLHPPCGAWFTAALSDARVVALVRVCGRYHICGDFLI